MGFLQGSTLIGTGNVMTSIAATGGAFFVASHQGLESGKKLLLKTVKANISKTCHSLKKLADMGHPYSLLNPNNPHPEKPYLIHKQSGNLLTAVRSGTRQVAGGAEAWVGIDEDTAPYARALIDGSPRMISRDFLNESKEEIKGDVEYLFKTQFGKIVLGAAMFYQLAHYAKWASKLTGGSRFASSMYKTARMARNAEVIAQGDPYGLNKRFLNVVLGGQVAKRFMVPGGGSMRLGGAFVNKYIMQEYGRKLFQAF